MISQHELSYMKYFLNFVTNILLPLFLFFHVTSVFGQAIVTDPAFPSERDPVTIIFDASKADRNDLEGYNGDVYAHTGVILSEEDKNTGIWQYVIAEWTENIPKARLSPLGNSRWELEIENIRGYYELPESEDRILQMAMVFRSSDGGLQSEDLFIDLFQGEVAVRINSPSVIPPNPYFTTVGESIDFQIIGTSGSTTPLSSITLFEGATQIATISDADTLVTTYQVNTSGETQFYVEAEGPDGKIAKDSLTVRTNPELVREARPVGIEDGITYDESNPGKVTLSLLAPSKDFVYVIGSFNNWEISEEYFMKLDESGPEKAHFWLEINGLNPGEIYTFQYFVNGEVRTADPFSELILDPFNDQFIPESVYPNLPEYPAGLTTDYVTVIEPGREAYVWQVTDFERPAKEDLVIYEMVLRDFLDENSFNQLADTLGYLERLGVNAIELMPVSQFDGNISWGYNPNFHGALDKFYGNRQSFKRFVDEAHRRGMAVILDVVYNHAQDRSPLIRTFGSFRSNSFSDGNPLLGPGHRYNVFFHLNHDHEYIKYWLDRMNRYWIETYNVDGYRFDLTKGFAANQGISSNVDNYNPGRVENLKRMGDELWSFDPDAYIILEHFQRQEEVELSPYGMDEGFPGMLFWNNMNGQYSEASMGYRSNLSNTYFGNINGLDVPTNISFMESHDEQWIMFRNLNFGNDGADYDIRELPTALQRQKLTGAFFFTIPGPKMLWQFGELGYGAGEGECLKPGDGSDGDCLASDPGRTDPKPIRWDYYDDEERNRLYRSWSELLRLRNSYPVFSSAETGFSSSLSGFTKWIRLEHEEMDAMIIGNFDVSFENTTVTFSKTGTWYDFVSGTSLEVGDVVQEFDLAPGEFRIYTSEPVEPAEEGVFYEIGRDGFAQLPSEFSLEPNFPNPFNPSTNLKYDVPIETHVKIEIYDILGRKVSELVDEEMHGRGTFLVTFDGAQFSSGVYIARLISGDTTLIQKMTLIK